MSPRKGCGCAYRAATSRSGYSGLAYRAIRRHGLRRGGWIARERLLRCSGQNAGGGRPVIASRRAGWSA
ncbi:membrane protein insertion efficiency factor YidD [Chromobacterium vaccinii]|uniref:membrane protein insertion efficiency factor YidD n=1 Tax=Chromobacterium vaccinii TaxID=1108595 RepID=UPI000E20324B